MTAQLGQKLMAKEGSGLYLHVPFCAKECEYCAFYKERADRAKIESYLAAIEEELKRWPPASAQSDSGAARPISTIFFGGGTPTLLSAEDLDRLCGAVRTVVGEGIVEWTVECAPATVKPEKLEVLRRAGVNRFSLGVQSFSPRVLEAIGRPHSPKQAQEAIAMLKGETDNWNLDLIFAAADSTLDEWRRDLVTALKLESKHLSTYCLTFESDTAFFLKMLKGSKKRPTPDEEARFYLQTWEILRGAGMHHYELANFARPGWECRHNLNTWRMGEWFGYGPSAASQVGQPDYGCRRYTNVADLESWAAGVRAGKRALTDEETLTPQERDLDALIFGLRMVDGVTVPPELAGASLRQLGGQWEREGLLVVQDGHWRLTDAGLLVADRIGSQLLEELSNASIE